MDDFASIALQHHIPKLPARADELVFNVLGEYRHMAKNIRSDESINLVCCVGGREFDVYSIGRFGNVLSIAGKTEDGTEFKTYAPIELVSFTIILSKKVKVELPREIGFHAEMEPQGTEK
jgi:hypothetical protein